MTCDEPSPDISSVTIMPPATLSLPTTSASMECSSTSKLYGFRMPQHLLDTGPGALFEQPQYTPIDIHVCSTRAGRPGATCQGSYAMLLDDWGFLGRHGVTGVPCAGRQRVRQLPEYYGLVQKIFDVTIAGSAGLYGLAASRMVFQLMGMPAPYVETTFYMSFRGEGDHVPRHPLRLRTATRRGRRRRTRTPTSTRAPTGRGTPASSGWAARAALRPAPVSWGEGPSTGRLCLSGPCTSALGPGPGAAFPCT